MNKESLINRRKEAEDTFNTLQNQKKELQDQIVDIDTKLVQLQGRHAELNDLIEELEKAESVKKKPAKANVIDVTDVEGA